MEGILPVRDLGGEAGTVIGKGLAGGINALTEMKLQGMKREKEIEEGMKLWKSVGLSDEHARAIASQSKEMQKDFFERYQSPSQESQSNSQQQSQLIPGSSMPGLSQSDPQQQSTGIGTLTQGNAQIGQPAVQNEQANAQANTVQPNNNQGLLRLGTTKEQQRQQAAASAKEQAAINKEAFKYLSDIQKKAKGSKENNMRLSQMETYIKSGRLSNPKFASLIDTLGKGIFGHGIDLSSSLSGESQAFDKLSKDMMASIKDMFPGGRILDIEIKNFLKTIPNLSQTNEGKMAVIRNLRLLNQAHILRQEASAKLTKLYGKNLPRDFENIVEESIRPELSAIEDEFKKSQIVKVPETEGFFESLGRAIVPVSQQGPYRSR
jgi:hypothetical protein